MIYPVTLMLNNLRIKNYRIFDDFELQKLARVNLIVGMNNSGKSSLLEAIHLLTSDDPRASLLFVMDERGEFITGSLEVELRRGRLGGYQTSQIFHDRLVDANQVVHISSTSKPSTNLEIRIQEVSSRDKGQQQELFDTSDEDEALETRRRRKFLVFERTLGKRKTLEDNVPISDEGLVFVDDVRYRSRINRRTQSPQSSSRLVTPNYLSYEELAGLWDGITLTPKEDKVVEALQILEPRVERISFTSSRTSNSGILIRLRQEQEPVPLGSMGDGMRRILAVVASLVTINNGTLLVDEIDTGLYYGALKDMWRLVIETSTRQEAQVFATTHSWDCVRAFQEALADYDPSLGCLLRLESNEKGVQSIFYSAEELSIAIEHGIEVR